MARKGILGSSLNAAMAKSVEEEEAELIAQRSEGEAAAPRPSAPTVKNAARGLQDEDRHATRLISPNQIRMSRFSDRLDPEEGLESLIESIRKEEQKVPILVRRVDGGEYEVVYGRRRVLACRALRREVRAQVMDLSDEEALIAQGVENNERRNTSFIERALFAYQLQEAGIEPGVIQKVMGVDESLVRKMRAVASGIPRRLVERIGPAPDVGRRQWEALKQVCQDLGEKRAAALADMVDPSLPSSERLAQVITTAKPKPPAPSQSFHELAGGRLAAKRSGATLNLRVTTKADRQFFSFLEGRLADLYKEWKGE
jgi:ParB family chromosome partitioning protein